ncbi:MAG TPA: bifunctional oligoribonuclease/PAP phosphatase NrnA [Caldithrix abyssi]|uniref:Bifunctional oligoribonuclease/PAP phosphatase NrnA n=1 Tax=Caldithrix abyssi TaxID=187145 RepID=A0A7V5PNK6_CALAY|nr:bifunctional oligoribonuclease/PAP phosphatase NrnA [Caldithrix abyssi]
MNQTYEQIRRIIDKHQHFVITSHINTDGDALGSSIALFLYLRKLNKSVQIAIPGDIPERYQFIGTSEWVNRQPVEALKESIRNADVIFILDISALDRLDVYHEAVMQSPAVRICIDHHPIQPEGLELCLVDTDRIATAEIIYQMLSHWQAEIDQPIATALYTAILSDSGSFRFQGTSHSTLQMAAELIKKGLDPSEIYSHVYETARHQQLKAWGEALCRMQSDGFVSYVAITGQWLKERNLSLKDLDGLIDIMRKDGQATVFGVFVEKNRDETIVGLRSKNGFDVGALARAMGGGGHFHASGFTANLPLEQTVERTLSLMEQRKSKQENPKS